MLNVVKKAISFIVALVLYFVVAIIIKSLGEMLISAILDRTKLAGTFGMFDFGSNIVYIALVIGFSGYYWSRPKFAFQKADIKDYLVVGTVLGLIAVVADVIVIFLNIAEVGIFDMFTNAIEDVIKLF